MFACGGSTCQEIATSSPGFPPFDRFFILFFAALLGPDWTEGHPHPPENQVDN